MTKRRILIASVLALFLGAILTILWTAMDWPPPKYLLKYGLSPGCEPTGKRLTIEGVEFVEIGPGIFRMGSTYGAGGSSFGKLCASRPNWARKCWRRVPVIFFAFARETSLRGPSFPANGSPWRSTAAECEREPSSRSPGP